MSARTVLFESEFVPSADGHGGDHRALQICELLRRAGFEPVPVGETLPSRPVRAARGLLFALRHGYVRRRSLSLVRACSHIGGRFAVAIRDHEGVPLIVWESHAVFLPDLAHDAGFRVVALPAGLDPVMDQKGHPVTRERLPRSLESEMRGLGKADAVFTISREEQWLLRLWKVDAEYLPYYPAPLVCDRLLAVRAAREHSSPTLFLILGTANNPPTMTGMREQLQLVAPLAKRHGLRFEVAGFGTERLSNEFEAEGIRVHGGVTAERLHDLLVSSIAVVSHQRAAAGALTRIPELLVAGVPFIGSAIACRSAERMPGVGCYDSIEELESLLLRPPEDPPVPPVPALAELRFLECVSQLVLNAE
jgi:hypothetical protein